MEEEQRQELTINQYGNLIQPYFTLHRLFHHEQVLLWHGGRNEGVQRIFFIEKIGHKPLVSF